MQVQVNTDNATDGRERFVQGVEATVRDRLSRYSDRISRIEVHLSDVNGDRGGIDKRCMIEMRPNGLEPLVATDQAETMDAALSGAVGKSLAVLDRTLGKLDSRRSH